MKFTLNGKLCKRKYISFVFHTITLILLIGTIIQLTLSQRTILASSKLKEFADDNFKFDENGIKFSERAENTVGKVEIARYEQFFPFSIVFCKRLVLQTRKNQGLFGKELRKVDCYSLFLHFNLFFKSALAYRTRLQTDSSGCTIVRTVCCCC